LALVALASAGLVAGAAPTRPVVEFVPATPAYAYAAKQYRDIWNEYGERIIAALETRTCLRFPEPRVTAVVGEEVSNSGGPEHPLSLRASYPASVKESTLVHELGHRHLWQLTERLDGLDGHHTLFLVLDRVWADVWGAKFADYRVAGESAWIGDYDYAGAWAFARARSPAQRTELWNELLRRNGMAGKCTGPSKPIVAR
jgi:hypothetical protein